MQRLKRFDGLTPPQQETASARTDGMNQLSQGFIDESMMMSSILIGLNALDSK